MKHVRWTVCLSLVIALCLAGGAYAGTLEAVKKKGFVNAGVSGKVVGFSAPDAKGV